MSSEVTWLALIISSNTGMVGEPALHYADADASELAATLAELGPFAEENIFQAPAAHPDDVTNILSEVVMRASELNNRGDQTGFLVYYTGHASAEGLHLHNEVMPLQALKVAARVVPADARIYAIDACQSGTLFRTMGVQIISVSSSPPSFTPPPNEAWITSSGAEEQAFEIDQKRGSLFTHFFTSALRGAADRNGDRQVTLGEVFQFVAAQTTSAAAALGQTQTPQWSGNFTDLVLSDLQKAEAGLMVQGPVSEPLLIIDRSTARVVGEFPVGPGGFFAVPAGRYQLLSTHNSRYRYADIKLEKDQVTDIDLSLSLANAGSVRSKGGLVVGRPWRVGVGLVGTLGAAPQQIATVGGALRVDRAMGLGHDIGLVSSFVVGNWKNDVAKVENRRFDLAIDWTWDIAWKNVRAGPGIRVGAGWLHQDGEHRSDGEWGPWYGDAPNSTSTDFVTSQIMGLFRAAVPLGKAELQATAAAGIGTIWGEQPIVEPLAQGTIGMGWSFR